MEADCVCSGVGVSGVSDDVGIDCTRSGMGDSGAGTGTRTD